MSPNRHRIATEVRVEQSKEFVDGYHPGIRWKQIDSLLHRLDRASDAVPGAGMNID
jgi:hypothetical protein